MHEPTLAEGREFLKDAIRQEIDFSQTDQQRVDRRRPWNSVSGRCPAVDLPPAGQWKGVETAGPADGHRRPPSHRPFMPEPLTLDELSFLLWATQGVRQRVAPGAVLRTVPSAGNGTPWKPTSW